MQMMMMRRLSGRFEKVDIPHHFLECNLQLRRVVDAQVKGSIHSERLYGITNLREKVIQN